MGMAMPQIMETPKPRHKKTIVCPSCWAEYTPNSKWVYGRYAKGTTGEFITYGKVPEGVCPICRKKEKL